MRYAVVTAVVLITTMATLWAQKIPIDPAQNHLFVLADKTSTLQMLLDQAASSGLHVLFGSDQGVFLTRAATNDAPGAYRPIAANGTQEFERALNGGGEQGFRVIPATLTRSGNDTVAIMRRAPGGPTPSRYRVLAADDGFDKNLTDLASKGFVSIGVFTQQSGMAAQLGRPGRLYVVLEAVDGTASEALPAASGRLRVLSTTRTSTMEKEINQAAAEGYRVKGGSFMNVLVEKVDDQSAKCNYRVIAVTRGTTLRDEIRQAGREGYRVVPSAVMGNPGSKLETVVVMEHSAEGSRSYRVPFCGPPYGGCAWGARGVTGDRIRACRACPERRAV